MSTEHNHVHHHSVSSHDEFIAVLRYMAEHNIHHTQELEKMAHSDDIKHNSKACEKLLSAINSYKDGNALLTEALELMNEPESE